MWLNLNALITFLHSNFECLAIYCYGQNRISFLGSISLEQLAKWTIPFFICTGVST